MGGLDILSSPLVAILWLLTGAAAIWDLATRRIPNPLIVVGLFLGAAVQIQLSGALGLGIALIGATAGLGLMIVQFSLGVVGGGDAKLTMVCGMFLGAKLVFEITVLATALHGAIALLTLGAQIALRMLGRAELKAPKLPYAVPVAASVLLVTSGVLRLFAG